MLKLLLFFASVGTYSADVAAFAVPGSSLYHPPRSLARLEAAADYDPMDGEKPINLKIDLEAKKVASLEDLNRGEKKVFCRDNVGPLIVSTPKADAEGVVSTPKANAVENSKGDASKATSKIEGRKKRVILGYRLTAIAYLAYCQRYFTMKGVQSFAVQVTSGYVLAAGLAYILATAAKSDRLASDTYKRLNLSLLLFGGVGVLGWALVQFGETVPGFTPILIPPLLGTINGIKGYAYGALGWDKAGKTSLASDFSQGVKSTSIGYVSPPKNVVAAGYLAATWMVMGMKLSKLWEILQLIQEGSSGLVIFTRLSRFARYAMLSSVLYTLKDAADRGRLEGTTFIQLNGLSAGVLAAMAYYYIGIGSPIGTAAVVFSAFSALNGVRSIVKKRQAAS